MGPLAAHAAPDRGRAAGRRAAAPSAATAARAIRMVPGVVALVLLPFSAAGESAGTLAREYDLKATFLFHFTQFVDWPADAFRDASSPITIGILGEDPFGRSLDEVVANETVHTRKLMIRRLRDVEDTGDCHILFISASETNRLDRILAALHRRSVLTVGEPPDFTARSGMIGFDVSRGRMRLRINRAVADAARLTISSQLLRQATIVRSERRP